jgi:phage N-6-adenine-methyltransferase
MNKALLSSQNMCWCTPQDFFDKLNEEFGFVLDPAATDKTAKCAMYYTPETDGLSQSWDRGGGAVFCNPPYGREIGKWVKKAFEEARGGIRSFYSFRRAQTRNIFTITYTGKQKSASYADDYASQTPTVTPLTRRLFRRW